MNNTPDPHLKLDSTDNSKNGPTVSSKNPSETVDSLPLSSEDKDLLRELIDSSKQNLAFQRARPSGYSKRSVSPYYKEENAKLVLPALDYMIANREAIVFRYDSMPGVKKETLKARIYQGLLYIGDHMDKDKKEGESVGKYGKLIDQIEISTTYSGAGIALIFGSTRGCKATDIEKDSLTGGLKFTPLKDDPNSWKAKLEEILATIKVGDRPVKIEGMVLTDEEIEEQTRDLEGIAGLVFVVKKDSITLARTA